MPPDQNANISFGERLISAFVSALAAAVTLLVLPWVAILGRGGSEVLALYDLVLSTKGLVIIAMASIGGMLLGSKRIASVFGIFWGTHPFWDEEWFQFIVAGIIIVAATGTIGYFIIK